MKTILLILAFASTASLCRAEAAPQYLRKAKVDRWWVTWRRVENTRKCPFEWSGRAIWCRQMPTEIKAARSLDFRYIVIKTGINTYSINGGKACLQKACLEWDVAPGYFDPTDNLKPYIGKRSFFLSIATTSSGHTYYLIAPGGGAVNSAACLIPALAWNDASRFEKVCAELFGE